MSLSRKKLQEEQANYYTKKVNDIKDTLPSVNEDPLKYLKRAYERWEPAGGKPKFYMCSVTITDVQKMISHMKNVHAYGHDDIDSFIVKLAAPVILPVITHIINLSLGTSTFPHKWKIARVLPLLKSRDLDSRLPGSYYPVAQLSTISKLTERALQSQILIYLERTNQIATEHHAYRNRCSTITALITIMDQIAEGFEDNEITATLGVDQTAAFDCVDLQILMDKLNYYGLDKQALDWIKSYMSHRSLYVAIGSAKSNSKYTKYRVPQGSVMGPLLYLMYMNDFLAIV